MDFIPEFLPTHIRDRRNQLADLSPEDRFSRLTSDLRVDLQEVDPSQRLRFIDSLAALFPPGHEGEGAAAVPVPPPVATSPQPIDTNDLVAQLKDRLRGMDTKSRNAVLTDLNSAFAGTNRWGAQETSGTFTWTDLGATFDGVAQKTRAQADERDVLLNEKVGPGKPTAESEFVAELLRRLSDSLPGDYAFDVHRLAQLAAVLMVELGCLEGLARNIVLQLDKNAFDQIHGQLIPNPQDRPREFLAEFLKTGDPVELARRVRNFNGLVKGLLWWYRFALSQGVTALNGLSPMENDKLFKRSPQQVWDGYKKKYADMLMRMTDLTENSGSDDVERSLYRNLIKKVSATLADNYQWSGPESY